jgi:TolA-binding protein
MITVALCAAGLLLNVAAAAAQMAAPAQPKSAPPGAKAGQPVAPTAAELAAAATAAKSAQERAQARQKLAQLKSEVVKAYEQSLGRPIEAAALRSAKAAAAGGDTLAAIATLTPLVRAPGAQVQDETRLFLGRLLVDWGMEAEAVQLLRPLAERATPQDPVPPLASYQLLRLYYDKGDYANAAAAFLRTRERLPLEDLTHALYLAGNSYLRLKDFNKAVAVLDRVPPASPYYAFALYSSGLGYLSLGDAYSSTLLRFHALTELQPKADPTVRQLIDKTHVTVGYSYIDQKRFQEAIAEFTQVPDSSLYADQARFGLGWTYLGMGECVKAIVIFEQLTRSYPVSPYAREGWLNVGSCYSMLNAYNKSIDSYRDALTAYSEHRQALRAVIEQVRRQNVAAWLDGKPAPTNERVAPFPAPAAASSTAAAPAPRQEAADTRIWKDLLSSREVMELLDLYRDARALEQAMQGKAAALASTPVGPAWTIRQSQLEALRRQIEDLARATAVAQLESSVQRVDELALHANIGIAKSLSILVDNAGK